MSTGIYPEPHVPVDDYTDIRAGDVIRSTVRTDRGQVADEHDYVVTDVETHPRDLTTGALLTFPCRRLHVAVLEAPPAHQPCRALGDVKILWESTRIVDATDTFVRADRRYGAMLADYVAARLPAGQPGR
ncbi:hypothetical protein GS896_25770 [Rhodococcus hoagii]|nr:hypothetical protein [Prescottella equi]MBM4654085.1 hypothetical protein [Prescottella equi]MBM4719559.1 hypothetical protein [Prescottella equi]NKR23358.1 hypothetical protein [Prescottella equi]NKT56031.1 hypothetical protein [Prescottella equi]